MPFLFCIKRHKFRLLIIYFTLHTHIYKRCISKENIDINTLYGCPQFPSNSFLFVTDRSQFLDALPHFFRDKATGQVLVDFPSFSDARSPKTDIAAAYFSKKVLDQAQKLKVVLVENHANLMDGSDGSGFSKLLHHVAKMVPDIDKLQNSLGFVVAKVHGQEGDEGEVMENVLNYIAAFREDLVALLETQCELSAEQNETRGMLKVLDAIYANGTAENLALFRAPDQEGVPWTSPMMSQSQRELRVLLFGSLQFQEKKELQFPHAIAIRSRDFVIQNLIPNNNKMVSRYLSKVLSEFQDCIEKEVRGKMLIEDKSSFLVTSAESLVDIVENSNLFESLPGVMTLKEKLVSVCNAWKNNVDLSILDNMLKSTELLYNLAESSLAQFLEEIKILAHSKAKNVQEMRFFYEFLHSLNKELQSYHVQTARKSVYLLLNSLNYKEFIFNLSKFNIKVDKKDRVISIEPTKRMLSDLNTIIGLNLNHTVRLTFNNFGQDLIYEGRNVFLSEIIGELTQFQNLENVHIFAYKTIFIDADINLKDAQIFLMAPYVEIIGKNRTIEMIGSDGKGYTESAIQNSGDHSPAHGLPGEDGHDAGNVLVLALEVIGADHLIIKSKGGKGGNGQTGGVGVDGAEVASPHFKEYYPEFNNGVATWEKARSHGYTVEHLSPDTFMLTNRQGWALPSGGGHGGVGGRPGIAGNNMVLSKKDMETYPEVFSSNGQVGEDGRGGKGGKGAPTCAKRTYKGQCKTRVCELWKPPKDCNCFSQSIHFCDPASDANNGLDGLVVKDSSQREKFRVDWKGLVLKLKNSVLLSEGLQIKENQTDIKNYVDYAKSTLLTMEQVFKGMHSHNCRP